MPGQALMGQTIPVAKVVARSNLGLTWFDSYLVSLQRAVAATCTDFVRLVSFQRTSKLVCVDDMDHSKDTRLCQKP